MQARLMLAQQAIQANMLQHQQQPHGQKGPPALGTEGIPGAEGRGNGGPDLSTMANAMGMLQGMQGANKEAMMKQVSRRMCTRGCGNPD
jgi:hypothetical protein